MTDSAPSTCPKLSSEFAAPRGVPQQRIPRIQPTDGSWNRRLAVDSTKAWIEPTDLICGLHFIRCRTTLSAAKHKEHYKKSTEIRHNLSKAYKKELRAKKYQKWLEMNGREPDGSLPSMGMDGSKSTPAFLEEGLDSPGFVDETEMTTSMSKLRTAKEVSLRRRAGNTSPHHVLTVLRCGNSLRKKGATSCRVTSYRRRPCPRKSQPCPLSLCLSLFSSRCLPVLSRSGGNKYGQYRFQMDHTGFDFRSGPVPLSTPIASPATNARIFRTLIPLPVHRSQAPPSLPPKTEVRSQSGPELSQM